MLVQPPGISLVKFLRKIGEKMEMVCELFKSKRKNTRENRHDLGLFPCRKSKDEDARQWSIYLYVNTDDPICASYFEPPKPFRSH